MTNYLDNGAVLPHGLLGHDAEAHAEGFNKSYKNTSLRFGVITQSYVKTDPNNKSKLATEYDVVVIEQNQDKGTTTILYRNCLSVDGLGSIADFFEKTFRYQEKKTTSGEMVQPQGQNGAVVLILCLDGASEKGIIIGAITHPDRGTTLTNQLPRLEGEYNGVNIKVENDGSCTLTFKGATDNNGKVTDPTQGNTEMKIEKDGSYQVDHKTITQRFDKNGQASLTATDFISNTTQTNFLINATQNINFQARQDYTLQCNNIMETAQGSALLQCQNSTVNAQSNIQLTGVEILSNAESLVYIQAPAIVLDGLTFLGGDGGQPVLLLTTQTYGVGNLGAAVISYPISGYALRTFAQ